MNPLPLEYHPHADYEIGEAFEWYLVEKRSPTAADRFLDELEIAFERIVAEPDRWPMYLGGARRFTLRHFPYHVVYQVLDSLILVIAVAHIRRRPGYWRWRLK